MTKRPPWWPTAEQKRHADAGCAHPDVCKLDAEESDDDGDVSADGTGQ